MSPRLAALSVVVHYDSGFFASAELIGVIANTPQLPRQGLQGQDVDLRRVAVGRKSPSGIRGGLTDTAFQRIEGSPDRCSK